MPIWSSEIKELDILLTSIKGSFPELEKELEQLIDTKDVNVVMLYSRRCLEIIITDLCECELNRPRKTEPLKGIINKLHKEEKVPSNIFTSMDHLNSLSTFGAHPKDFDPEQVKPVLLNLATVIKWYLKYKADKVEIKERYMVQGAEYKSVKLPTGEGSDASWQSRTDPEDIRELQAEEKQSKNWKKPTTIISGIIVLGVAIIVIALYLFDIIGGEKQTREIEKSIAVLPFENWDSDKEYLHLGDAITDEIILQLQYISEFDRVLSRSSTMQFKDNRPTVPEIAEKLGVNYIIEGSIQRQKDNVIIRVQVIRAKNEDHVWGDEYHGKWEDIFFIQDDIAKKVAQELKIVLTPMEIERIEKKPTENLEAYNQYLLGRFFYNQHVKESIKEGIKYFNRAIKLDSTLALAYVSLAQSYQFLVRYSWIPRDEGYKKAKETVLMAIELDESLGEAHAALGLIMIVFDLDIYGPDQEFQKAIKLSPNSSEVYSSYAQYLRWLGRYDEALIMSKRAIELDPLTPLTNIWPGVICFYAGRYDESIDYLKKLPVLDSNFIYAYSHLAFNYTLKGLYSEAIQNANKTMSIIGNIKNDPLNSSVIGWVYAKSGEKNKAREILAQIDELYKNTFGDPIHIALIYDGLGEHEKAIDLLLKAYEIRSGQIIYLKAFSDSFLKDISSDPRYIELLKKIGFEV